MPIEWQWFLVRFGRFAMIRSLDHKINCMSNWEQVICYVINKSRNQVSWWKAEFSARPKTVTDVEKLVFHSVSFVSKQQLILRVLVWFDNERPSHCIPTLFSRYLPVEKLVVFRWNCLFNQEYTSVKLTTGHWADQTKTMYGVTKNFAKF